MAELFNPLPLRFMRRRDVERRTGLSRSTIYAYMSEGTFPTPIRIGAKSTVAWLEHEIEAWMRKQINDSRDAAAHA